MDTIKIMSLFGKDIEENICTLITFTDGAEPPVLASFLRHKNNLTAKLWRVALFDYECLQIVLV